MADKQPYSDAAGTGQYVRKTGLSGKYDNVRRYWEDKITQVFLRPYLMEAVERKTRQLERLKILDLGCGTGDGYDMLMQSTAKDAGIYEYAVEIIHPETLGLYIGLDINPDLLNEAREIHALNEKVIFSEGSFSEGLPIKDDCFDIYFTSYGSMAHNRDEQTITLLSEIASYSGDRAIVVLDWLGRYSYEWQDLWEKEDSGETFMDYRISYIYPPEERPHVDIQSFKLRLLSRDEIVGMVEEATNRSGIEIKIRQIFDRSIFVGRHMDTCDYNKNCPEMRIVVNSLLEPNVRTDLSSLIIDYIPRHDFPEQNNFFDGFSQCWNALVNHTIQLLMDYNEASFDEVRPTKLSDLYSFYPEPLKKAVKNMTKVVKVSGDLPGDSRANIIEPQLAFALRGLEMDMQPGYGMGHGIVTILEIIK